MDLWLIGAAALLWVAVVGLVAGCDRLGAHA